MSNNFDNNSLKDLSFEEYAIWWFNNIKKDKLFVYGRTYITVRNCKKELFDTFYIIGSIPMRKLAFLDMKMLVNQLSESMQTNSIQRRYKLAMEVYSDYCERFDLPQFDRIHDFDDYECFENYKCYNTDFLSDKKPLTFEDCKIIAEAAIEKYPTGTQMNRLGYAIVVLAYGEFYCAEELLGLEWADVDMYNNTINVRYKAVEEHQYGGGYVMEIKKSDAPRIMKFSEKVKDALIELYKITGNQKYVMTTSEGNIMLANALRKLYNGALNRAGYNSSDYISTTIGTFCRIMPDWLAENRE